MEEVTVVKKGRVLEILLNRPKVNAIDLATSRKLGDAFVLLRDDPELWVSLRLVMIWRYLLIKMEKYIQLSILMTFILMICLK